MSEQDPVDNAALEEGPPNDPPEVEPAIESSAEAAPVPEPEPEPKAEPEPEPKAAPVPEALIASAVQPAPVKSNAPQQPAQRLQRDKTHITPQYARQQNGSIFGSILRKIKSVTGLDNEYPYSSRRYPNTMNPNSAYYYSRTGRGNIMPPAQQMAQSQHQTQPQHQPQSTTQIQQQQQQQPPQTAPSQPQQSMNSQLQINPQHQKQQQEMSLMPNMQHQLQMMNYMPNMQHYQQLQMMNPLLRSNMMNVNPFFHHYQHQQQQQQQQQQAQMMMMMTMMMMDQQYQQQQAQQAMIGGGPMAPGRMFGNPGYNDGMMMPQMAPFGAPQMMGAPYRGYEGANQSYYQNHFQPDWGQRAYFHTLNNRNTYIP